MKTARLLIALLLLAASGPLQAQRPLDDPFQVNVRTEAFEASPDATPSGIFARRFDRK